MEEIDAAAAAAANIYSGLGFIGLRDSVSPVSAGWLIHAAVCRM